MGQTAKHITFTGRVQGVGFRFTAFRIANRYSLTGMVRNTIEGSVEMLAQGTPDDITDCVRDIKESFTGYVKEAKIKEAAFDPQYTDFKITF